MSSAIASSSSSSSLLVPSASSAAAAAANMAANMSDLEKTPRARSSSSFETCLSASFSSSASSSSSSLSISPEAQQDSAITAVAPAPAPAPAVEERLGENEWSVTRHSVRLSISSASSTSSSSHSNAISHSTQSSCSSSSGSLAAPFTAAESSWHGRPRAATIVSNSPSASPPASCTVPMAYAMDGISLGDRTNTSPEASSAKAVILTRTRRSKTLGDALVASRHARKASASVVTCSAITLLGPAGPPPSCPPPMPVLVSSTSSSSTSSSSPNRSRASSISSNKSGRSEGSEGSVMAPRRRSSLHHSASSSLLKKSKLAATAAALALEAEMNASASASASASAAKTLKKEEEDWSVFIKNGYSFPISHVHLPLPLKHHAQQGPTPASLCRTASTESSLSTATTATDASSSKISSSSSARLHAHALTPGFLDGTQFTLHEAKKSLEWLEDELAYPSSDEEDRLESKAGRVRCVPAAPVAPPPSAAIGAAGDSIGPSKGTVANRKKSNSLSSGTAAVHGHAHQRWAAAAAASAASGGRHRSGSASSDVQPPLPASLLQIRAEHMSGLRGARSPSPMTDAMSDSRRSSGYTASSDRSGSARSRPSTCDSLASSMTSASTLSSSSRTHNRSDSDSSSKADIFTDASQTIRSPVKIPLAENERLFSRLSMDSIGTDFEHDVPCTDFKKAPQLPPLSHLQIHGTGTIDFGKLHAGDVIGSAADRRNSFLQLAGPTIRRRASSLRSKDKDRDEVPSSPTTSTASSLLASPPLGDFVAPQPPSTLVQQHGATTTKAARAQLLGSWLESSSCGNDKGSASDSPVISPLRAHFFGGAGGSSQHPFTRSAMDVYASSPDYATQSFAIAHEEEDSDDDPPPLVPTKQTGLSRAAMNRLGISTEQELLMPPPQLAFPRRPSMPDAAGSNKGVKKTLNSNKSMQELNPHRRVMTGRGGAGARVQVMFPQSPHVETDSSSPTERAFSVNASSGSDTLSRTSSVSHSSEMDGSKLTVESSPRPSFWRKLSNASRRDFSASEAEAAEAAASSSFLTVPAPGGAGKTAGTGSWGFRRMRKTTLASNIFT